MREETCSECRGSGWIINQKEGREFARRCQCRLPDIHMNLWEKANIPARFKGAKLSGFELDKNNRSHKQTKARIQSFIDDYPATNKGLLLHGATGVGKTRLLCAIATEIIAKNSNEKIYYIDWNDLVRLMRSGEDHASRDFSSINQLIQKLVETDLLLFDELGASKVSSWVQDYLYYLFNKRYNLNRITVCATNFYDSASGPAESLTDRIGHRIRSRLYEMANSVELGGHDYRRKNG